jgi:hypothetical protein
MTHTLTINDFRCVVTVRELERTSYERSEHFGCPVAEAACEVVAVTILDWSCLPEPDEPTERLLLAEIINELQTLYGSDAEINI